MFGADVKRALQRTHVTNWNAEPWALGAMSGGAARRSMARARPLMEAVQAGCISPVRRSTRRGGGTVARCVGIRRTGRQCGGAASRRCAGGRARKGRTCAAQARPPAAMSRPALIAWSSGKDSAWALHEIRRAGEVEVIGALTTVTSTFGRVRFTVCAKSCCARNSRPADCRRRWCEFLIPVRTKSTSARWRQRWLRRRLPASLTWCSATCFLKTCAPIASSGWQAPASRRCFRSGTGRPMHWRAR